MVTNKDVKLAESVRKFPVLYNKSLKEFKDRNVNSLIWLKIANELKLKSDKKVLFIYILYCCAWVLKTCMGLVQSKYIYVL